MIRKLVVFVLVMFLITGCSGGPSEDELAVAFEQKVTEQAKKQAEAMKAMGAFLPKSMKAALNVNVSIQDLVIEEQSEKENGDFVSKVTMVLVKDNEEKRISMRLTTTEVDGRLKILESGTEIL